MKKLIRFAMVALVILFATKTLSAQTPIENLQSAVETYNAMREYQNGFTAKTIAYTIDNPLLEYRKDHYLGFVLHMGITMGLNFGPGRS